MTDLEMTRLCAEAMGLIVWRHSRVEWFMVTGPLEDGGYPPINYDPLHDDAQAMAIVKRFKLGMAWLDSPNMLYWEVAPDFSTSTRRNYSADLNRAIVSCVAKMQATK